MCNGIGYDYEDSFRDCCSTYNQCGINQGGCNSDNDCSGDLICGSSNCPSPFPSYANCCEKPKGNVNLLK